MWPQFATRSPPGQQQYQQAEDEGDTSGSSLLQALRKLSG